MAQHLIHIGYPKAGSTFLQAWFERHPELRYKHGGLGGFHNVYEIAQPSDKTYKYYVTSYEGFATPQKSAGGLNLAHGGAEPDTDDRRRESQVSVCAVLKSLYPESRILIMTRGFKGMIVSSYSQYVRMGGVLHLDGMCQKLVEHLRNDTLHFYDIDALIQLYGDAFGEENLIVLPYELLRDDQNKFIAVLEQKLGLEHFEIKLGRINPSLSPEELYWYPLISRTVSSTASRLGPARFRKVYGWYVRQTLDNRLRRLVKVLRLVRPDGKITETDFPDDILSCFEGKAARLVNDPLYRPYAAEYLWKEATAAS